MLHVWRASGEELFSLRKDELLNARELKQRLHSFSGLPRFRQRLLHDGASLDDDAKLDSVVDLQLVLLPLAAPCHKRALELLAASAGGRAVEVEAMLSTAQDPDVACLGLTPLYAAAQYGHAEVVALLLEACAHTHAGKTPSTDFDCGPSPVLESGRQYVRVVRLEIGERVERDWNRDDCLQVVRTSLAKCCDTAEAREGSAFVGSGPLFAAAGRGHAEVVRLLLGAGADKDQVGSIVEGPHLLEATSLYMASREGHVNVVRQLLSAGADMEMAARSIAVSWRGQWSTTTPVGERQGQAHLLCLPLAVEDGNIIFGSIPQTPLLVARFYSHVNVERQLLAADAEASLATPAGCSQCLVHALSIMCTCHGWQLRLRQPQVQLKKLRLRRPILPR